MVLRIIPDGISFNFVRWGGVALAASVFLVVLSVALVCLKGVVLGTDFTGGVVLQFQVDGSAADAEGVSSALISAGLKGISVQSFDEKEGREFMVVFRDKVLSGTNDSVNVVKDALQSLGEITYKKVDFVGAQIGFVQVREGIFAVVCALVCMFLYLWFRFRWQFALGGVLALVHDIVITMGMVSVTGIEFGLPALAAVLMIIGYSVNDSVVIYDRVRELLNNAKSGDVVEVINTSINSTLSRTLLTSSTTVLATVPLILLCDGAVRDIGIIAAFGVIVGTYSSIFVSTIPFVGSLRNDMLQTKESSL